MLVLTGLVTLGCSSSDGRRNQPGLDGGPDGTSLKGDALVVDGSAADRMSGKDGTADQMILDQAAASDGAAAETSRETLPGDLPGGDASLSPDSPSPSDVPSVSIDGQPADGTSQGDLALGSDTPIIIGPSPDAPIADTTGALPGPDSQPIDRQPDDIGADLAGPDGPGVDLSAADLGVDSTPHLRSWSTPKQLDSETGTSPSVAVDPLTGNAVVAWADLANGVRAIRYTAATDAWSDPILVSSDLDTALASVVVDAHGHWLMVWSRRGDGSSATNPGIWSSTSGDGATWSAKSQLFAGGAKNFDSALRVAMNRSGQAMIVWDHFETPAMVGTQHKLYAMVLEGSTHQPEALIASQLYELEPAVAIDGTGKGLIAWSQPDPTVQEDSAWAATFSMGTVATPALLENYDSERVSNPLVAMNAAGQGIAVWAQTTTSPTVSFDIYSRRFTQTGSWASTPDLLMRTSGIGNLKSVVMDSAGTAHLAWSHDRPLGWQCAVSSQPLNGSWSTQDLENDNLATSQYVNITEVEPALALDANDNLLAGWRKKVSDTEYVPNFRWRIGNTWGAVVQTGLVSDLFSNNLALAASDDGRAVAAWNYSHCDPAWKYASTVCPTAKTSAQLSAATKSAWGTVHAAAYR
jgi:hypothetical protein